MKDAEKLYQWWENQEIYFSDLSEFEGLQVPTEWLSEDAGYVNIGLKGESNYQENIDKCNEMDIVFLIPEPNNPYDHNAIKVCRHENTTETIGYIPKEIAGLLSPLLKDDILKSLIDDIGGGYGDKKFKGI
jgi:hypothetical protein